MRDRKKVCILIDGANLYYTSRKLGFDMDYDRLKTYYKRRYDVLRMYYYTAVHASQPGREDRLRPVLDWMNYNGYTVVSKLTKEFTDRGSGETKTKGNMDMEIAVDAMFVAPHVEEIILISGDGDFTYLVNKLKFIGKKVTVVSTISTTPAMIADELRREADEFVDLSGMIGDIMRENNGRTRED